MHRLYARAKRSGISQAGPLFRSLEVLARDEEHVIAFAQAKCTAELWEWPYPSIK
jgi:hypothetical protein